MDERIEAIEKELTRLSEIVIKCENDRAQATLYALRSFDDRLKTLQAQMEEMHDFTSPLRQDIETLQEVTGLMTASRRAIPRE